MYLYLAGAEPQKFNETLSAAGVKNILFSYYNTKKEDLDIVLWADKVFCDSGAFSAYTKKAVIDIDNYANFLHTHGHHFEVYANLDSIGNADKTYKNQKYLESLGLEPLPVFHAGENFSELKNYIDSGYEYIAIGGIVPLKTQRKKLISFIRKCFEFTVKETKFHAFGMTDPKLLELFDWYSADSTSWLSGGRRGAIYSFENGKMRTLDTLHPIPGTKQYKLANLHNAIQWGKYQKYLSTIGRWKDAN